eukprot:1286161-Pyramimonas_sp.AAC.1
MAPFPASELRDHCPTGAADQLQGGARRNRGGQSETGPRRTHEVLQIMLQSKWRIATPWS